MKPEWKRAGRNGELEIKFPTGRRFKVEKHLDENERHKGEWKVMEYKTGGWVDDWEWIDTYKPKGFAKQKAMQLGQYDKKGKKVADYSSTFQYESVSYECQNCAEYGSELCKDCLNEKEIENEHPNCGTPDCCGECETANVTEELGMTTASAGIPQDTKDMGPRFKAHNVTDRRRRKDKSPVVLKRFRKYMEEK